ncbi:MAG: GumC family protein [Thermoguttaceae bacterium]
MTNIPDNQSSNAPERNEGAKQTDSTSSSSGRQSQKPSSSSRSGSRRRPSGARRIDRRTAEAMRHYSASTTIQAAPGAGRELNFFDFINILERQAWIVIVATVIATAISGYLFVNQQKRYSATASVYIPATNSVSILTGVDRGQGANLSQNMRGDKIETHAMIVKSYQILANTWRDILKNEEKRKMMRTIDPNDPAIIDDEDEAIAELKDLITVKIGGEQRDFKDANTISITCETLDPSEAAMIVNTVVEQYQLYFTEKYNRSNSDVRMAIEDSKNSLEAEIEAQKKDLFEYIQTSDITFIGSEENNPLLTSLIKMSENMVEIDFQLLKFENRVESLEATLAGRQIDDLSEAEIITLLGSGEGDDVLTTLFSAARGSSDGNTVAEMNTIAYTETTIVGQINELKMKLVDTEKQYAADHPTVVALRKQLEELEDQLATTRAKYQEMAGKIGVINYKQLFQAYMNALQNRMSELREEKSKINTYVEAKDSEVRNITEYRETIETKKLSIESLKTMLDHLEQSLKGLALMSDVNAYQVEVLAQAIPDTTPVYPSLFKFVAVGFMLGLILGVAIAYLVDITDATFHSPIEVVRACRVPILLQLPSLSSKYRDITPRRRAECYKAQKPDPALIAYYHPNDTICELFRQLRTRLFNQPPGSGCVVVMGTSPHPTDGKTLCISNIAVKVAEAGKKVLLIDGDMRKPDIHKWFGLINDVGLSNVLAGAVDVETAARPTLIKNLDVMTAGTNRKAAAELVASQNFDQILAEVREIYDVVLIDAPPALYVNDSQSIAPRVDGVLYIFRIRRRGRPDVVTGVKSLVDVGANILGCIVNLYGKHHFYNEAAIEDESHQYGGYGYGGYGSYGGYGYGGYGS